MSELEQLTNIIDVILSPDNEGRKNSEALLQQLREQNLNNYINLFCSLITNSQRQEARIFAISHIRRVLSNYVDAVDTSSWYLLNAETQKYIKEFLFTVLTQETNSKSASLLSDLIGELAATIKTLKPEIQSQINQEGTQWPELMQNLWAMLTSGNELLIQSAFEIMGILFTYCSEEYSQYKDELLPVFTDALGHSNLKVRATALGSLASYLKYVDSKDCKGFIELLPTVFHNMIVIVEKDEDLAIDVMAEIEEVVESEPKIFKKYLKELFDTLKAINQKSDISVSGLRDTALKILTVIVQRLPNVISKNIQMLKDLFEVYFTYMVSNSEEPDKEWKCPPEGFLENDTNDEPSDNTIKFCMSLIDEVIEVLEEETTLPILSQIVLEMVKVDNWKYQYSALMALSQIGEYIDDVTEIDPIMQIVFKFMESTHPKVRYSAAHCIGQIANDMKGDFALRYYETVIPLLIRSLNDSVPRVTGHSLAALTNVLESCSTKAVKPYITSILEPCVMFLANGISLVKENALTTISTLAKVSVGEFIPYWQKIAEIVFGVLNNSTSKEYKYLRGHCIECLTLMGLAIGETEFQKAAHEVIQKMLEIQQNDIVEADPQKFFLMAGWKRICMVLKKRFTPYLKDIVPSLFNIIDGIVNEEREKKAKRTQANNEAAEVKEVLGLGTVNPQDKLFYTTNTSETQDIILCADMLGTFLKNLGKDFLPYIQKTSEVLIFLINNSMNDEVRFSAAYCLPDIIKVVQDCDEPDKQGMVATMSRTYVNLLWSTALEEFEAVNIAKFIFAMKNVMSAGGRYMDQEEITVFSERVIEQLRKSDSRKVDNQKYTAEKIQDLDEEDQLLMHEENKNEEELQCALADLMGALFESHKELTLPLVQFVQKELLPRVFGDNVSPIMNKFGVFLIDNMIEYLGLELIPNEWPEFAQVLIQYATHPSPDVRQAAVYGIGVLAEKSGTAFRTVSEYCLKALIASIQLKRKEGEDREIFFHARDNAVSSLGKIIKSQSESINLQETIQIWLNQLPLKHDKLEARIQHELLIDIILESNATLVFGEKGENLPKVVKIFAEVVDTRLASENFRDKVGKVVGNLIGNDGTKQILQDAVLSLEPKWQEKLQKVVSQ